jgi:hypothetical protein
MKLAAVLCLLAAAPCAAQTGSISGVVRHAATGEPIAQAAVGLHM